MEIFDFDIINYVKTALLENEFAQGGFIISVLTALWYSLRNVPLKLFNFTRGRLIKTVTIRSEMNRDAYCFALFYLGKYRFLSDSYSMDANHYRRMFAKLADFDAEPLSDGNHWCRLPKIGLIKANVGLEPNRSKAEARPSIINLSMPFWKVKEVQKQLFSFEEYIHTSETQAYEYNTFGDITQASEPMNHRDLIVDADVRRAVFDDLEVFLKMSDYYQQVGQSHYRGYLLAGPPGSGKSTIAKYMAHTVGRYIVLSLGRETTDDEINSVLSGNFISSREGEPICVIIEDIDAYFVPGERKLAQEGAKWSFTGLLNAINGINTASCVLVMTTNHPENLDSALIRKGRIHKRIDIDFPSESTKKEFLSVNGISEEEQQQLDLSNKTMAELSAFCIDKTFQDVMDGKISLPAPHNHSKSSRDGQAEGPRQVRPIKTNRFGTFDL